MGRVKRLLLISFVLVYSVCVFSQTIKGRVDHFNGNKIYLEEYYGERTNVIDSSQVSSEGEFIFTLRNTYPIGMYKLTMDANKSVDLILNGEDFTLSFSYIDPTNRITVENSTENVIFYEYQNLQKKFHYKKDLLQTILDYYPLNTKYYKASQKEFLNIQKEIVKYENDILKKYPDLFVTKLINFQRIHALSPNLDPGQRNEYYKKHFFDYCDFSDTALLRTPILTKKLIDYLSFYNSKMLTRDQLENEFIEAIAVILEKTNENSTVYQFVIDYLLDGFESFGFEKILQFIAENSNLDVSCTKTESESELEHRLEIIKKLAIGKNFPTATFTDIYNKEYEISQLENDILIVIFWASWCPHCNEILPEIKKIYEQEKLMGTDIEVVAISIDTDKEEYAKAISGGQYNWINVADMKGWESDLAIKYGVAATPSIFVLDKEKTIITKPLSTDKVVESIEMLKTP